MAKAQELRRQMLALRRAGKFVECYLETAGEGSNGTLEYYLASACDDITLAPAGDVNLLGDGGALMTGAELAVAVAIGEDAGTLEEVYEPFLIQNGFLMRTPRGRGKAEVGGLSMLTPHAIMRPKSMMRLPPISLSSSAVRRMWVSGVCQRMISGTMLPIKAGSPRSLSY